MGAFIAYGLPDCSLMSALIKNRMGGGTGGREKVSFISNGADLSVVIRCNIYQPIVFPRIHYNCAFSHAKRYMPYHTYIAWQWPVTIGFLSGLNYFGPLAYPPGGTPTGQSAKHPFLLLRILIDFKRSEMIKRRPEEEGRGDAPGSYHVGLGQYELVLKCLPQTVTTTLNSSLSPPPRLEEILQKSQVNLIGKDVQKVPGKKLTASEFFWRESGGSTCHQVPFWPYLQWKLFVITKKNHKLFTTPKFGQECQKELGQVKKTVVQWLGVKVGGLWWPR